MPKNENAKCGFCNFEFTNPKKELETIRPGRKTIIVCPNCKAILGVYYA
ncbi:MAG: hypothetical protein ACFE9N_00465 [Promethearchaeota archaeon]